MPTFNVELANKVLVQIEAHPEQHQQDLWRSSCGTAMCFAGWTVPLTEAEWAARPAFPSYEEYVKVPDGFDRVGLEALIGDAVGGGEAIHVEHYAATALGLDDEQAGDLFQSDNDLADLKRLVAEYTAEAAE